MEIKIDTKKDSKEEILKTIEFLKTIADSGGSTDYNTDVSEGTFNMFNNDDSEKKEEKSDDKVKIIEY